MAEHSEYVLIGGGLASASAAQAIRQRDGSGKVTILAAEPYLPYDRPPLSKENLRKSMTPEDIASVKPSFYKENDIAVLINTKAESIDREAKVVHCADGREYNYGKLLIATGSSPRTLDIPGDGASKIHYLRSYDDSVKLRESLEHSRSACLIGGGYISVEVAAACIGRNISPIIIEPKSQLWSKFASRALGEFLDRHYERQGVKMHFNDEVAEINNGSSGLHVITKSGQGFTVDMVLAGVGVTYNSNIAKDAGLEVDEKGRIKVDQMLQTTRDQSIWAAGDLALYFDHLLDKEWNAEHYMNALWMGEQAGKNMSGHAEEYARIPYFFSDMGKLHMLLRGRADNVTHTRIIGSREHEDFLELYRGETNAVAMAIAISHNEDKLIDLSDPLEQLIRNRVDVDHVNAQELGY